MKNRKILSFLLVLGLVGCRSSREWRDEADDRASSLISSAQSEVTGKTEPIEVESASDTLRRRLLLDQSLPSNSPASKGVRDLASTERWSGTDHLKEGSEYAPRWDTKTTVRPTLLEAIEIAAKNNRDFQSQKEQLFQVALALDLEAKEFRTTFRGMMSGAIQSSHDGNRRNTGGVLSPDASFSQKFKNGVELTSSLSVDLAKMLTGDRGSSFGIVYDGSIAIPLLRGSGEFVVTEPLTQAQRNLVYQVREFE